MRFVRESCGAVEDPYKHHEPRGDSRYFALGKKGIELCSTGEPRTAVPTWFVVTPHERGRLRPYHVQRVLRTR